MTRFFPWMLLGLLAGAVISIQGYWIWSTRIDLPYWDDWSYISGLTEEFNWTWVWGRHNDHRAPITNILIWLLVKFDGWNQIHHALLNYVIFSAFMGITVWQLGQKLGTVPNWFFALLGIFPLSTLNWENFDWGQQSELHLWLILTVVTCVFAAQPIHSRSRAAILTLAGALLPFTEIQGVVSLVIAGLAGIWLFRGERKTRLLILLIWIIFSTVSLFDYQRPAHHADFVFPTQAKFWSFFLLSFSRYFGYSGYQFWPGLIGFLFVVWVAMRILFSRERQLSGAPFALCLLAFLGATFALAIGRAGFGEEFSGFSRYFALGALTLPMAFGAVAFERGCNPRVKSSLLALLVVVGVFGFEFRADPYVHLGKTLKSGLSCITRHRDTKHQTEPVFCPEIFPNDLRPAMNRAVELELSTVKTW